MLYQYVGIDHVQIAAPPDCEEIARNFYSIILGMEELPKPDKLKARGGVWFQCGRHQLHIGVQGDFKPAKKAHPAFEVQHIDMLQAHLESHGIPMLNDDAREGAQRFYIEDPFGNRIEFVEWLHPNDMVIPAFT